jgi:hypothetical protein
VQEAQVADAGATGRVVAETWRAQYRGLVSDDYLAVRPHPLIATLRFPGEAGAWLVAPGAPTRPAVAAAA